jgi:hypothetical protein
MDSLAKLIFKTQSSNLSTELPAYFYGLPNGKVYVVYSRFYEVNFEKSALEFVVAILKEFTFDFERETLFSLVLNEVVPPAYYKLIDCADPKMKIKKVYRNLQSYNEVFLKLNKKAEKMQKKIF